MVLPLVDEDDPKCFLCHVGFGSIEELREHQQAEHREFFESHGEQTRREPAPGDVTMF